MNLTAFAGLVTALFDSDVGYWLVKNTESIVEESYWTIDRVIELFTRVEHRYPNFVEENFPSVDDIVNIKLIASTMDSAFRLLGDETKEVFVHDPPPDKID